MSAFGVVRYTPQEHLAARIGFAALLLYAELNLKRFSGQPAPTGLARWVDLSFTGGSLQPLFLGFLVVALLAYVAGKAIPWALLYLSVHCIVVGTLRNSQGAIGHSGQLMSLVLVGQTLAYAQNALPPLLGKREHDVRDLAWHYSKQMVAAVYVIAGLTKLIQSKGGWLSEAPNLAVSMVKAAYQEYYNHLEPGLGEQAVERARFMLEHENFTRLLFGPGLLIELGAFLALYKRTGALIAGLAIIALHQSVNFLMSINFYYNSWVVVIYLLNLPGIAFYLRDKLRQQR